MPRNYTYLVQAGHPRPCHLGNAALTTTYTYNGLGLRVGRELIMKDNTHGYTDFHDETPSVETGIDKPEVVKESYVIDYTSPTFQTLVMEEDGGFDDRWVYGLDKLSVKITSEGTNWWGQNVKQDILKDYLHQDRLGSTTNLTDKFGRVVGRADYNEWGEVTYKEALSITSSYRRIYPQLNYTGHDWDDVLEMYYAKARFYDPDAKRFVEIDPVKGQVTDPLSLVSYLYCKDNPLRWVDPLGLYTITATDSRETYLQYMEGGKVVTASTPIHKVSINNEDGYASLRELMAAYGFSELESANKKGQTINHRNYDSYVFSKNDKRIYVQMDVTKDGSYRFNKVSLYLLMGGEEYTRGIYTLGRQGKQRQRKDRGKTEERQRDGSSVLIKPEKGDDIPTNDERDE